MADFSRPPVVEVERLAELLQSVSPERRQDVLDQEALRCREHVNELAADPSVGYIEVVGAEHSEEVVAGELGEMVRVVATVHAAGVGGLL